MMDMPAVDFSSVTEAVQSIDWQTLEDAAMRDYGPAIAVIKQTWDKETLLSIAQGRIAVPDTTINEAIAKNIAGNDKVKSLTIASRENGRLEVQADTVKAGRIEFSGDIKEFVHDKDRSYMTYQVKSRSLKDHGLASWFFSRISLSMAQRLFGKVEMPDDLPTTIKHNTITVDFHQLLESSELGQTELEGYKLLDMIEIKQAVPHEGYVEFQTELDVPDEVKAMLIRTLS
jgi:hypothetical protein